MRTPFSLQDICIQKVSRAFTKYVTLSELSLYLPSQIADQTILCHRGVCWGTRVILQLRKPHKPTLDSVLHYQSKNPQVNFECFDSSTNLFHVHHSHPNLTVQLYLHEMQRFFYFIEGGSPFQTSLTDLLAVLGGVCGTTVPSKEIETTTVTLLLSVIVCNGKRMFIRYKFIGNWDQFCLAADILRRKIFFSTDDLMSDVVTQWGTLMNVN